MDFALQHRTALLPKKVYPERDKEKDGRLTAAPWIFSASAAQNRKSLVELARRLASDSSIKTLVFAHSAPLERGVAPLVEFASRC